jgi:hypothetical protein
MRYEAVYVNFYCCEIFVTILEDDYYPDENIGRQMLGMYPGKKQ